MDRFSVAMLIVSALVLQAFSSGFAFNRGYDRGWQAATQKLAADKAAHDATMRKIGICLWAKKMADYIECGGDVPMPKKPGPIQCTSDNEENCS